MNSKERLRATVLRQPTDRTLTHSVQNRKHSKRFISGQESSIDFDEGLL